MQSIKRFANWIRNRVGILPAVNLISNIGFGAQATHTVRTNDLANLPVSPMHFPLLHPVGIIKNVTADQFTKDNWFLLPLWKKVLRRVLAH